MQWWGTLGDPSDPRRAHPHARLLGPHRWHFLMPWDQLCPRMMWKHMLLALSARDTLRAYRAPRARRKSLGLALAHCGVWGARTRLCTARALRSGGSACA